MRSGNLKENRLIAIVTDFGLKDSFVGTMKGVIYGINPKARIVDISHDISLHNTGEASFVLNSSRKYFPSGTVFLAVVDPGVGSARKALILKTSQAFYVAPDNGVLSEIYREEKVEEIIEITKSDYLLPSISNTFHGRDIFSPVAAHLSTGVKPEVLGKKIDEIIIIEKEDPFMGDDKRICASVIYIDKFGNIVTDISKNFLESFSKDYKIKIKIKETVIFGLKNSYAAVFPGEFLAIIGSFEYLEISVNQGNAADLLKCEIGERVYVELLNS